MPTATAAERRLVAAYLSPQGGSWKAVACQLGMSEGNVRARVSRALARHGCRNITELALRVGYDARVA